MDNKKISSLVMKEFGLEKLPPDKQEKILAQITEVILKKLFLETLDHLDKKAQEEFGQMLEEGKSPEEVEAFLTGKISNYDEMLAKVVGDYKTRLKEHLAQE